MVQGVINSCRARPATGRQSVNIPNNRMPNAYMSNNFQIRFCGSGFEPANLDLIIFKGVDLD